MIRFTNPEFEIFLKNLNEFKNFQLQFQEIAKNDIKEKHFLYIDYNEICCISH